MKAHNSLEIFLFREDTIPEKLPAANVTEYNVGWTENAIDPASSKGQINYCANVVLYVLKSSQCAASSAIHTIVTILTLCLEHKAYLEKFLIDFERTLKQMMLTAMKKKAATCVNDPLSIECMDHLQLAKTKVEAFQGRETFLEKIKSMINEGNDR